MNGATKRASQSTEGRSDPPVKPTSEVAHQPGQQQAAVPTFLIFEEMSRLAERHESPEAFEALFRCLWLARGYGSAVECSTERPRAPDRQPVAPVEGRAWETPATRTV